MKVYIDAELCTGHGRCAKYAPNVYRLRDEDGYNADVGRTIEVPFGEERNAALGAKSCPERAILVVES